MPRALDPGAKAFTELGFSLDRPYINIIDAKLGDHRLKKIDFIITFDKE